MNNPARWETDPTGRFRLRYWDGQQWTQHVSNGDGSTLHDSQPIVTGIPSDGARSAPSPSHAVPQTSRTGQLTQQQATGRTRPQLRLATHAPATQNSHQVYVPNARVLNVPAAGQVGEIHTFAARLKQSLAVVIHHDLATDQLQVVTERGEVRETNSRLRTAPLAANPLITRPGRLWWAMRNDVSRSFPEEAQELVQQQLDQLTASASDETIAFGLEAIPHGLDGAELHRLGVEPWRIVYEQLRLAPGSDNHNDRAIRTVLRAESCPPTIRLALALHTGAAPELALRHWHRLFAAIAPGASVDGRHLDQVISEAREVASVMSDLGLVGGEQILRSLEGSESADTTSARILRTLSGSSRSGVRVDTTVPLSLVDDIVDAGCQVTLTAEWDEVDQVYVKARQQPAQLTNDEVLALDFTNEALRRAYDGDLHTFGHLLDEDEQLGVAIASLTRPGQPLDRADLETLGDSASAQRLRHAVDSGDWGGLPSSLIDAPGVGDLLVRLPAPDRDPRTAQEAAIMSRSALHTARESLFNWEFDDSIRVGQRALAYSTEEVVRDELMNVVAAALWMRGKESEALHLLRKALEGQYTVPLVCNAAAVAATLDVSTALSELSRLTREAPDEVMRLVAAERAFTVWRSSVEDEDDPKPPDVLKKALRSLLTLNVSDDRYRQVLRILAEHDSDWLASQPPAAFGRRGASPEARVYRARAKGLSEFIAELSSVHNVTPRPQWVEDEAVRLGSDLIGYLTNNFGDDGASIGVSVAMDVLGSGLPLPAEVHVRLVTLVSASVGGIIEDGEPKDEFIDWFHAARRRVSELSGDDRSELVRLFNGSGDDLARSYLSHRQHLVNELIDIFNGFLEQADTAARNGQLNERAFKTAMRQVASDANGHVATINKALAIVTDAELKKAGTELRNLASDLQSRAKGMS